MTGTLRIKSASRSRTWRISSASSQPQDSATPRPESAWSRKRNSHLPRAGSVPGAIPSALFSAEFGSSPSIYPSPVAAPSDLARYSVVKVPTETVRDARTQVADLVEDLTRVSRGYRDDSQAVDEADDPATADLYNGYAAIIDKIRWMLQAMMDDDRMN